MIEINNRGKGVIVIIRDANASNILTKLLAKTEKKSTDFKEHGVGAQILRDLGVREMILLSKVQKSIVGLEGFDLKIVEYQDIEGV